MKLCLSWKDGETKSLSVARNLQSKSQWDGMRYSNWGVNRRCSGVALCCPGLGLMFQFWCGICVEPVAGWKAHHDFLCLSYKAIIFYPSFFPSLFCKGCSCKVVGTFFLLSYSENLPTLWFFFLLLSSLLSVQCLLWNSGLPTWSSRLVCEL